MIITKTRRIPGPGNGLPLYHSVTHENGLIATSVRANGKLAQREASDNESSLWLLGHVKYPVNLVIVFERKDNVDRDHT